MISTCVASMAPITWGILQISENFSKAIEVCLSFLGNFTKLHDRFAINLHNCLVISTALDFPTPKTLAFDLKLFPVASLHSAIANVFGSESPF